MAELSPEAHELRDVLAAAIEKDVVGKRPVNQRTLQGVEALANDLGFHLVNLHFEGTSLVFDRADPLAT